MLGRTNFHGGIHPPQEKERTAQSPIESFPSPSKVIIRLGQHAGSRAQCIVKQGDRVRIGQTIGEPATASSVSVHASVSGKVLKIDQFAYPDGRRGPGIEIENDGADEIAPPVTEEKTWREMAPGELIRIYAAAGIVGMGRTAFPTHIKLSPPSHMQIRTFVVNGMEDEPYLTADYRLMIEKTEEILIGALIVNKTLGVKRAVIAVDGSKLEAAAALSRALKDPKFKDIAVARLKPKYPQGAERMLTKALMKKQVPSGGSPADIGCVVLNVATVHAIYDAVCNGNPLVRRVVTVSGPKVRSPKNLLVPIGTPLRLLLDFCGVDAGAVHKVVMGGPMTGQAQSDMDVSIGKSTAGIIAFDKIDAAFERHDCINCGSCVKACPMILVPSLLAKYVRKRNLEEAFSWGLFDCIECGSCAYVCPSKIDLVHFIKLGKYLTSQQNNLIQSDSESLR